MAVRDELLHVGTPKAVKDWVSVSRNWLEIHQVEKPHGISGIHRGESETLQLALQLRVETVLMDDMDGRSAARKLGIKTVGTIGIIERAAEKGEIDLADTIAKLKSTNFFVSDDLLETVLKRHRKLKEG